MDAIHLLWNDILSIFTSITFVEISNLGFFGLLVMILLTPLKGIDKRDPLACMVYVVFITGCGATLLFALPNQLAKNETTFKSQCLVLIFCAALACARWSYRYGEKIAPEIIEPSPEAPIKQ